MANSTPDARPSAQQSLLRRPASRMAARPARPGSFSRHTCKRLPEERSRSIVVKLEGETMNLRFAIACSFLMLSACATTQGPAPKGVAAPSQAAGAAAFRTSDFAWSTTAGRGQIDGQLTYKPKGVPYGCAAAGVILTPETPWVRSRMIVLYGSPEGAALPVEDVRRRTPPERSQDYSNFVKRATCDATGRFSFTGLPDATWFAITVA